MPTNDSERSCCEQDSAEQTVAKRSKDWGSKTGMVFIEAGPFLMGTDSDEAWDKDGEKPVRGVELDSYYISKYTVSNAEFAAFVDDTGFVTDAEKFGWSYVFHYLLLLFDIISR